MPDLTTRLHDEMVRDMADIKRNFLDGNRSDAKAILDKHEPAAAAWIACQLGGAFRIADRQSLLNWLEHLATGGVQSRSPHQPSRYTDMTPDGERAEAESHG
jgi:hypothetical protein